MDQISQRRQILRALLRWRLRDVLVPSACKLRDQPAPCCNAWQAVFSRAGLHDRTQTRWRPIRSPFRARPPTTTTHCQTRPPPHAARRLRRAVRSASSGHDHASSWSGLQEPDRQYASGTIAEDARQALVERYLASARADPQRRHPDSVSMATGGEQRLNVLSITTAKLNSISCCGMRPRLPSGRRGRQKRT